MLVVSSEKKSLEQIKVLAASLADKEQSSKVNYCTPEELFDILEAVGSMANEKTVRGYRVKVRFGAAKRDGNDDKRGAVSAVIAKAMKRLKKSQ